MATQAFVTRVIAYPGSETILLARATNPAGNNLTSSNVSSKTAEIYDRDDNNTLKGTEWVNVYDSMRNDDRWDEDNTGFNIEVTVTGSNIPDSNNLYRADVKITTTANEEIYIPFDIVTLERLIS